MDYTYILPMFVMGVFSMFGALMLKKFGEDMLAILFTISSATLVAGAGIGLLFQGFEIISESYRFISF